MLMIMIMIRWLPGQRRVLVLTNPALSLIIQRLENSFLINLPFTILVIHIILGNLNNQYQNQYHKCNPDHPLRIRSRRTQSCWTTWPSLSWSFFWFSLTCLLLTKTFATGSNPEGHNPVELLHRRHWSKMQEAEGEQSSGNDCQNNYILSPFMKDVQKIPSS